MSVYPQKYNVYGNKKCLIKKNPFKKKRYIKIAYNWCWW